MAPDHRKAGRDKALQADHREAAVLVLLLDGDEGPGILLTRRRGDLPDHPGQISFPGGRREKGESLQETALREAREEVNLKPETVRILGTLTPLYIPPSNFFVTPLLAAAVAPVEMCPCDREVESLIVASLQRLMDPEAVLAEPWTLRGDKVVVPFYDVDGHQVWGATAMMLAEVIALCRGALSWPDLRPQGLST
jgi:8-oxo-dGTP pyrophosphatase MutT (NUDIX family)